jgi:putative colanic acid biosynthesis acetyltransferase WcaF
MIAEVDVAKSRSFRNYAARETILRGLWMFAGLFFRLSPRPCFGWRRWILICFGAKIGSQVNLYPSSRIYLPWNLTIGDWSAIGENVLIYNLGRVTIGEKVTISHGAHLCAGTHDYDCATFPLLRPPIHIEDQVWICTDSFIGPGVKVGCGAVIGARAVVTKNVEPWEIIAGNPAKRIGVRELRVSAAGS